MLSKDQVLEVYGPQLGELAWHSLNVDSHLVAMSEQHAASILRTIEHTRCRPTDRPIRILEIGAYAHYGAYRAAASLDGMAVVHDISPNSLRVGQQAARAAGLAVEATLVAGDFHDLPFVTGYFDFVFCASSVHHTFRPWRVLGEALRVLRPGGVFQIENEPVGRALSFYGFRGNRREEFTPFEAELDRRGSLLTFASPFPGSRPEFLFGMIENERIPLDMILATLTAQGDFASLTLVPQVEQFEQAVLALPCEADLEASLATLIFAEIQQVQSFLTERDQLLGARLPTTDDVWRLAYQVAPQLRGLTNLVGVAREHELARLFGAVLQATVIKHGNGSPACQMFSRPLTEKNHVYDDLPTLSGVRLRLTEQPVPEIELGNLAALSKVFPTNQWEPYTEEHGLLSMLNLGSRCQIDLPILPSAAILLLRFYAVKTSRPYRVTLSSLKSGDMSSAFVVQSESLLFRELLPAGNNELFIEMRGLDGIPLDLPRHIRIGVSRLIPVDMENDLGTELTQPQHLSDFGDRAAGSHALLPSNRRRIEVNESFNSFDAWSEWLKSNQSQNDIAAASAVAGRILQAGFVEPLTRRIVPADCIHAPDTNWREGLLANGLNSRMRAVLAIIAEAIGTQHPQHVRIFASEAVTPFALLLRSIFPRFVGSEYGLDDAARRDLFPIVHQDLTALALPSDSFDIVTTNEVLEHVPDLDAALREIARILKPGGFHIGTHPFLMGLAKGQVRSRLVAGEVVHLMEPEYHGNPVDPDGGSLVFETPAWDILERARSAGFSNPQMRFVASESHGYLTEDVGVFVLFAQK